MNTYSLKQRLSIRKLRKCLADANSDIIFVIDVDGVLTDGAFYYSEQGKVLKKFGPHDSDALAILRKYASVQIISADARGFSITQKRLSDMGFEAKLISSKERQDEIYSLMSTRKVAFLADSYTDIPALKIAN